MSKLDERIKKIAGAKVEKLKVGGKTPGHGPLSGNGGKREGSGRKTSKALAEARGLKIEADAHYTGSVEVKVTDPRTGRSKNMKKKRLLIVLDQLFKAAAEGDTDAANKWLDRALGKPAQPIIGDEDKPIMLHVDF